MDQDKESHNSETNTSTTSLGNYLQWERQKKQLSIVEVSEHTRIPLDMIESIESSNCNNMPAPVFVKGFLKIYAEFLGLDPGEVLDRYHAEWKNPETEPCPQSLSEETMAQSSPFFLSGRFALLLVAIMAALALAYFFFQANEEVETAFHQPLDIAPIHKKTATPVIIATAPRTAVIDPELPRQSTPIIPCKSAGKIDLEDETPPPSPLIASQPPQASPGQDKTTSSLTIPQSAHQQLATTTTPQQKLPLPTVAVPHKAMAPTPPQPKMTATKPVPSLPVNLHIRFTKTTHIAITQDNQDTEEYLFAAGEETSWRATRYISVNVENGAAVEVTVNGAPLPLVAEQNKPLIFTLPPDHT